MAEGLRKIIVIDSDKVGSIALCSLLQSQGFSALSIENTDNDDELSSKLAGVSLAIIDTGVGNAVELSNRIKVKQEGMGIIYTTVSLRAEEELLHSFGIVDVFLKPFQLELLLPAIRRSAGAPHH